MLFAVLNWLEVSKTLLVLAEALLSAREHLVQVVSWVDCTWAHHRWVAKIRYVHGCMLVCAIPIRVRSIVSVLHSWLLFTLNAFKIIIFLSVCSNRIIWSFSYKVNLWVIIDLTILFRNIASQWWFFLSLAITFANLWYTDPWCVLKVIVVRSILVDWYPIITDQTGQLCKLLLLLKLHIFNLLILYFD